MEPSRGFTRFVDKNAKAMTWEELADALADCIRFRDSSREHNDFISASSFDVMINRINAEIALRSAMKGKFAS